MKNRQKISKFLETSGLIKTKDGKYALSDALVNSQVIRDLEEEKKRRRVFFLMWLGIGIVVLIGIAFAWTWRQATLASIELAKKEQIVESLYFYQDRFALAVKRDKTGALKYGFIDRKGQLIIPAVYDEAADFDSYGFARVKIGAELFLIDSLNNRYPLAEQTNAITTKTLAVSLKEQELKVLPKEILESTQLKILYLKRNLLEDLPEEFKQLKNLIVVDLGYNRFSASPEVLSFLEQLKVLDLQHNQLSKFDESLAASTALEWLNLSNNKIVELPATIAKLKALRILDVSNNKLIKVDEALAQLSKIEQINLSNNELESVPEILVTRTAIKLNIQGNRMRRQGQKSVFKNPNDGRLNDPVNETYPKTRTTEQVITTLEPNESSKEDVVLTQKTSNSVETNELAQQKNIDQKDLTEIVTTEIEPDEKPSNPVLKSSAPNTTYLGNLDCENCFSLKVAQGEHQHLMTKEIILVSKMDFDYRIQFENTEEGVIGIVHTTAITKSLIKPMRLNDKIMFISDSGSRYPFSFFEEPKEVTEDGRVAYVNRFKLTRKEMIWLLNNAVQKFRLVDLLRSKMYPFSMGNTRSRELRRSVGCMYKELHF